MDEADDLLAQARRMRGYAELLRDRWAAAELLDLAERFEKRAALLRRDGGEEAQPPPPIRRTE